MNHLRKHNYSRTVLLAVITLALFFSAQTTVAQGVVNGSATATILTALTVTADSSLRFGNVMQGVAVTVHNGKGAKVDRFDDLPAGQFKQR